jgi:beta-glucosidase
MDQHGENVLSRIDQLIAAMTLAEKLGQLTMTATGFTVTGPVVGGDVTNDIRTGDVGNLLNLYGIEAVNAAQRIAIEESRLRIPLLLGYDVIHGHRTAFPIPLAEAGLFDPAAWTLTAREAAKEASADGIAMTFAPMLDVSREPRWGRTAEGPGEDAWLAARIATAKIAGFQMTSLADSGAIAAVAKHYCAYGAVAAGREYAPVDISERTLQEVHLPAFVAAVKAGVAAIMPAFTDLNGIPMTAHEGLLNGYLREQLGFDGVIVSDYTAIMELTRHGVAADLAEAAALALNAGVDIDMMSNAYRHGLPEALRRGLVRMETIDTAVRRVLILKERLDLFEDPYRRGRVAEPEAARTQRRAIARDVGRRAVVMLKNEGGTLPLSASRIALIGPLADAGPEMRGPWSGATPAEGQVSVLAGLRAALPDAWIEHALGVDIESERTDGIATAVAACDGADAVILCLGEAAAMSGEAASRAYPQLPGQQQALFDAVRAHVPAKPVIVILFSGRPLVAPAVFAEADAVLAAWFPGSEAGNALADILVGAASPSGRTAISWPRAVGQIPVFFGQRPTGRPASLEDHYTSKYLDLPNTPQFAFGHGLTYGSFEYSNLRITPMMVSANDTLEIRIDIRNGGTHTAQETVFMFTHDRVASVTRPLLELKGFGKITLAPGAAGTVALHLPVADLAFLGPDLKPCMEDGEIEILAGPNAGIDQLLKEIIVFRRDY